MDNIKTAFRRLKPTKRKLIQLYAALLTNAHAKGFIEGDIYKGVLKSACVPGLNCYSCPGAVGACPLGALQNALASSGTRAPWYVLGILMLFGLILGRTICGWLCPFGLIQELVHKIPTPKLRKGPVTRALSYVKYVLLALLVVFVPLAYGAQRFPVPAFCKYICPAGTLEGAVSLLLHPNNQSLHSMLGVLFTRKLVLLVLILIACVFIYRAFCRFLCPLGALYGLFARLSLLGVRVDASRCTHCGKCVSRCRMDVRRVGDHECIHCGECAAVCTPKAIVWQAGSIRLTPNEGTQTPQKKNTRRIIAWICALALLAGVAFFVNQPSEPAPQHVDTEIGSEVGMRCADFTVPLYGPGGGSFTLSEHIGRPVVINFWATWCTPCVAELPVFARFVQHYGNRISLVAIHSDLVTDDVQSFLDGEGIAIPFAQDEDGGVMASLGVSTMLPVTVVLDANGIIVYNKTGAVSSEEMTGLLDSLVK